MQVSLDWKRGLEFSGTAPTGFTIDMSSHEDGGPKDDVSPVQLVALGLGGCTAMDVIAILQKKKQDVRSFHVRVTTQRKEDHPKVWTHALIEYFVTGSGIDPAAVERAIQLSHDKYCPVQNMLKASVEIESRYEIKET